MARYVISNRCSGRFCESEKHASRAAVESAVAMAEPRVDMLRANTPMDDLARRSVMIDVNPVEIERLRLTWPDDVIVEPEIPHHPTAPLPVELRGADTTWMSAPVPSGEGSLEVVVAGGGKALKNAELILVLRGPGGIQRKLAATSGTAGRASFSFDDIFVPAALVVVPAGGFWSMLVRGPRQHVLVDCAPLPSDGPLDWWHHGVGATRFSQSRGKAIRVGVIDTGIGPHPCLDHVKSIGSFIDGAFDPNGGADSASHGTHVSGIIGSIPVVKGQYGGIAPGVKLYSARVFPPGGHANQMDISDALDRLSAEIRVDLVNLSLGASVPSEIERDAIRDARERGTLCICAAANANGPVHFPAAFPETVAVSALGLESRGVPGSLSATRLPQFSDRYGDDGLYLANFSCFGPEITCAAGGVGIISTVPERFGMPAPYAAMDGTSMASPLACGTLAAILGGSSTYKGLARNETRSAMALRLLRRHGVDVGLLAEFQGHGVPQV